MSNFALSTFTFKWEETMEFFNGFIVGGEYQGKKKKYQTIKFGNTYEEVERKKSNWEIEILKEEGFVVLNPHERLK